MSIKIPFGLELELIEIENDLNAAQKMVSDLCHGKREWIMSIPARPDYDPDLVIGKALRDGQRLLRLYKEELESE